jgi:hypothetical protein
MMNRHMSRLLWTTLLLAAGACSSFEGGGGDGGDPGPGDARADDPDGGDPAACPANLLCSATPLYRSQIGIWYTLWWMEGGDTGHWAEWSRYRPEGGFYRSGSGAAWDTQRAQLTAMGVDFLLLDHTNGIGNDGGNIKANGDAVVASLEATASPLQQAVAIGGALWMGSQSNIEAHRAETEVVWQDHARPEHPSRFLWGALPLLVVYTEPGRGDDLTDPRFAQGAAAGRADGASEIMRSRGVFGWVFDEPTRIDTKVMGVMPGWDTAHLGRGTTPIPREAGARFTRDWLRAIEQDPEIIIINSWNDFAEETAIEPASRTNAGAEAWADSYGTECPAFYYELARGYALLRRGLELGSYARTRSDDRVYRVTADGLVHQTAMPACHPVLFVPDGYLDQFPRL